MMYISDQLREELDYFKRMNSHYEVNAGKSTTKISEASDEVLYMCFAASLVMDYSEDGFFENFYITDKKISGKQELQIDAYALIETEQTSVKQLHIFQFKEYESDNKSASPIELLNFVTYVNNNFVHPEIFMDKEDENPVLKEIKDKYINFLNARRGNQVKVYCHYINNAKGITKANEKQINEIVLGRFMQDKQNYGFSIQVNGLQDILDLATEGKIRVSSETLDIVVDGQQSYRLEDNSQTSRIGLPKHVLIGMVNVNEFIRLQNKYHHNQLYTENIRLYLGDRGAVNKAIINTITSNESIWFPYMNNGISIICDSLEMGSINKTKKAITITMSNPQIINGCQTVNALYSAKYGLNTRDNFRAANVMVRVYEISPDQTDFKMSIIKATNNQNAVKSYSLVANDPIQKEIAKILDRFGILYDRKGEIKKLNTQYVIGMTNAAIAYRAVYLHLARKLRSGLGYNRVFKEGEYEKVFDASLLDDQNKRGLYSRCCEIIISSVLLDTVRDLLPLYKSDYQQKLPILMKSAFYLGGYVMAANRQKYDKIGEEMLADLGDGNLEKLSGKSYPSRIKKLTEQCFTASLDGFQKFYAAQKDLNKSDVDNLLKDMEFGKRYEKELLGLEKN